MSLTERRQQKLKGLEEQYATLDEKIMRLRTAYTLENDVATRFKLEKQIEEGNQDLEKLEQEIDELQKKVSSYSTQPGSNPSAHRLSGEQVQDLQNALLSAFPSKEDLAQMVRIQLNQNLAAIAGGQDLSAIVFNLITWAESSGRMQELIAKAGKSNPGNPQLNSFIEGFSM
jgi:chromosome segregation ATPase